MTIICLLIGASVASAAWIISLGWLSAKERERLRDAFKGRPTYDQQREMERDAMLIWQTQETLKHQRRNV